jgi:TolB-like protein
VVDAVRCAVEIQRELKTRNAELPSERKMEFRLGINVGDVIVEGERIYGDGVNIAARLEGLAEAGGICISGTVYDQIENKLALSYEYVGEQLVKNITKPVRVWRVLVESETAVSGVEEESQKAKDGRQQRSPDEVKRNLRRTPIPGLRYAPARLLLAGVVVILGGLGTIWYFFLPTPNPQPPTPNTQAAPAALPLPDKPSLIVLPFVNMSKDPEQEYFSDGITENLTTDLSQLSGFFVISRNSAFTYKGKAVNVKEVSRELGVRHVVEGSVQKAGDRVRINAQLVDAMTGHHVWAERYDRELKDIFTLQDEVIQKIVFALKVKLTAEEQARFKRVPTDNLEAYEYVLRGSPASRPDRHRLGAACPLVRARRSCGHQAYRSWLCPRESLSYRGPGPGQR